MMGCMGNYNQLGQFYRVSRINSEAKHIYPAKRSHSPFVFPNGKCVSPELKSEASGFLDVHTEPMGHNQG